VGCVVDGEFVEVGICYALEGWGEGGGGVEFHV